MGLGRKSLPQRVNVWHTPAAQWLFSEPTNTWEQSIAKHKFLKRPWRGMGNCEVQGHVVVSSTLVRI